MTALKVLGIVLLLLLALSLVRVGAIVEYGAQGLSVRLRAGPLRFRVFPVKPRKKKEKKAAKPKKKKSEKPQAEPAEPAGAGGSMALVKRFLPVVAQAAGALKRKIRIDRLYLDVTAAAPDPAAAALAFGGCNALVGMIWPLLEHNFTVKDRRIRTAVDFQRTSPAVYVWASVSLRVGQAVHFSVGLLIRLLRIFMDEKARRKAASGAKEKQKEAV